VWKNGDSEAWEKHFEKPSIGGIDYYYADAVDSVYFSGHGDDTPAFYFGTNRDGDGTYTYQLHYSEAEWGDKDMEWIFISACLCLKQGWFNSIVKRWNDAFKELHGMTGFHTEQPVYPTHLLGDYFAHYLTDPEWGGPYCIGDAWKMVTQKLYKSTVYAAIYRVVVVDYFLNYVIYDYWYDYLPGYGTGIAEDPSEVAEGWIGSIITLEYKKWPC